VRGRRSGDRRGSARVPPREGPRSAERARQRPPAQGVHQQGSHEEGCVVHVHPPPLHQVQQKAGRRPVTSRRRRVAGGWAHDGNVAGDSGATTVVVSRAGVAAERHAAVSPGPAGRLCIASPPPARQSQQARHANRRRSAGRSQLCVYRLFAPGRSRTRSSTVHTATSGGGSTTSTRARSCRWIPTRSCRTPLADASTSRGAL
jgi:hypothetical protein